MSRGLRDVADFFPHFGLCLALRGGLSIAAVGVWVQLQIALLGAEIEHRHRIEGMPEAIHHIRRAAQIKDRCAECARSGDAQVFLHL